MPYCPVCGSEVSPNDKFCPKCGTTLTQAARPSRQYQEKQEKQEKGERGEKREKQEKQEKREKYEKQHNSPMIQIAVGLIIIVVGVLAFISAMGIFSMRTMGAYLLLVIGVIVIVFAILAGRTASRRSPKP